MKIAVFGSRFENLFNQSCKELFGILKDRGVDIYIYKPFYEFLLTSVKYKPEVVGYFESGSAMPKVDMMFSIGGDGTFLKAVSFVGASGTPIVGINSGRLGFLADISQTDMQSVLLDVLDGNYKLHKLDLLSLDVSDNLFEGLPYALNELAITKRDSSSMITVHAYINNEYVNSYWADGLIIATATGSTAYSLSVGGPIMHPDASNFVITPIAPHNLTVRPMVVPNDVEITLKVEGRDSSFLASLDSRSEVFEHSTVLRVKKAAFSVNVIRIPGQTFFATLRNKLMWGLDRRNYL